MSTLPTEPENDRTVIMIHGRGWKPEADVLETLWRSALAAGLDRDHKDTGGSALLDTAKLRFVYYGDLSNALLQSTRQQYDPELDVADRQQALRLLTEHHSKKGFRRQYYESVPGKTSLKEFLVDMGAPLLSALHLTDAAISRRMPEVASYLKTASEFRAAAQERLARPLEEALASGDRILLLSHCLGSIIAYDVLWQSCHEPAGLGSPHVPRVDTWLTLGSPLADEYVKRHLAGAKSPPDLRYPTNLINWFNVAAEDDYTCHDESMANDFAHMLNTQVISQIRDFRIYNLAVRYGRSNPHHAAGYLVHPRTTELVARWLQAN